MLTDTELAKCGPNHEPWIGNCRRTSEFVDYIWIKRLKMTSFTYDNFLLLLALLLPISFRKGGSNQKGRGSSRQKSNDMQSFNFVPFKIGDSNYAAHRCVKIMRLDVTIILSSWEATFSHVFSILNICQKWDSWPPFQNSKAQYLHCLWRQTYTQIVGSSDSISNPISWQMRRIKFDI